MKSLLISALKISGKTLLEYFNRPKETPQKESQSSIVTEAGGIIKRIDGIDIQYSVREELIKENFPVIAGSLEIIESLKNVIH